METDNSHYHKQQIVAFAESESFSFLVNDLDIKMFEKFKKTVDKEGLEEVQLQMQGINQLLEIIQRYKNDLVTPEDE